MTLPFERTSSVLATRDFLIYLSSSKMSPRVPLHIRKKAIQLLKHYPEPFHMSEACATSPLIFGRLGLMTKGTDKYPLKEL